MLGPEAFVLRFFGEPSTEGDAGDRLLIVNLGVDLALDPAPEPLLAPPADTLWRVLWSSDDVAYGGGRASPRSRRGTTGAFPATPPSSSSRCPRPGRTIRRGGAGEETEEAETRREARRRLGIT